ncbi:MAG: ABC transporter permease [Thermoguttaceae bacterium]
MRALSRKLLRDLKAAGGRLLAVAGIIAVGVSCFVALATSYDNLEEATKRYYAQCRMADFSIELKKAPLAELAPLAQIPGVADIRSRIQFHVAVDLPGAVEPLNGLVLSLPDRRQPVISDIVLRRGTYFTDRRDNEVLVNDAFAQYHRLGPGDRIHLMMGSRRHELFVVGTAISSEFVYLLAPGAISPDPQHFGVFYLKHSFAEEVFDFAGAANQVLGRLEASQRGDPRLVLRQAQRILAPYGVFSTTPLAEQLSHRFLSQEIQGLWSFALITPAMFLAVAALVLNVLVTRLAQQQRIVIGTLKALGYSDSQLFWHLQKLGLSVGAAGGLCGCGLGYWLADGMTSIYRRFFQFPELHNQFAWGVHATAMAISIGCAVLGGLRGTRAVLRLRPAEAMRPAAPRVGRPIWLERAGRLWNSLSSGWRMVLRNVFRNRLRTAAGVFAAAMGASVLVNGFMLYDAIFYLMDFQFELVLRSDMDLTLSQERGEDALLEVARLPGVDRAEPLLSVPCTFRHGHREKKGSIIGLAPDARMTVPRDLEGRPIRIPGTGLAMSRTLAEQLGVRRGQSVTVEPVKGLRRPAVVPVNEISEGYLGTAVYADLGHLARLVNEEFALSGVQLALDKNPEHLQALHRELKRIPVLQATSVREATVRGLEETVVRNQWIVIAVMVAFAAIVFFGSILNASLASLAERQREVATLRVLGYGPWQIGGLLLRESMIVNLAGTALGMPLGYLLTLLTARYYASEMFRLPIIARAATWEWTLGLAVAFTLGAHLVVQRVIHRMDWLEALKAQE